MSELIQNAIYIPEADKYIASTHQHDFVIHDFDDGAYIGVDGGIGQNGYARRVAGTVKGESMSVFAKLQEAGRYSEKILTTEDNIDYIRENLLWGTRGKSGEESLEFRPVKELALKKGGVKHMKAILADYGDRLSQIQKDVINYWIEQAQVTSEKTVNWT